MSSTGQLISLDDSPAVNLRDHYGFEVSKDYALLYNIYEPLWEAEEGQREAAWSAFLTQHAHLTTDHGSFTSLTELGDACLQDVLTIAGSEPSHSKMRKDLDELVHNGIPFQLRGKAWTILLDISVRKEKNYYQVRTKYQGRGGECCVMCWLIHDLWNFGTDGVAPAWPGAPLVWLSASLACALDIRAAKCHWRLYWVPGW